MEPDISAIRAIDDPVERARQAGRLSVEHASRAIEASRVRKEAVSELSLRGMSNAAIGRELGISGSRVGQILKTGPAIERIFLGDGPLTVVMARKPGAERRGSGSLVAQEDHKAYDWLSQMASDMELDITDEVVAAPCEVDLNRPNLIVLTGPRMALNVGELLARDAHIQFGEDDRGWHLTETDSGTIFRSPMDEGKPYDYAYFGRIPRPDGRGTFLYAAGIHAMGELGVIHLLRNNIVDLYSELKLRPFSTIVSCRFDSSELSITDSQRVTPLYYVSGK